MSSLPKPEPTAQVQWACTLTSRTVYLLRFAQGEIRERQPRKVWVMGPACTCPCPQGPTCTWWVPPTPGNPDNIGCRIGGNLILNLHMSLGQYWQDSRIPEPSCISSCHPPAGAQVLSPYLYLSGPSVSHSQWLPVSVPASRGALQMGRAGTLALSAGAELRSTYPVTYF